MTDTKSATLVKGNNWGNDWSRSKKAQPTGTSRFELRLGPGQDGVRQTVNGLHPGTTYTLSAWMRVSDKAEAVELGVSGYGGKPASVSVSSTRWGRRSVSFKTGPKANRVTIHLRKSSDGAGHAWCDNLTLPLRPPASEEQNARQSQPQRRVRKRAQTANARSESQTMDDGLICGLILTQHDASGNRLLKLEAHRYTGPPLAIRLLGGGVMLPVRRLCVCRG